MRGANATSVQCGPTMLLNVRDQMGTESYSNVENEEPFRFNAFNPSFKSPHFTSQERERIPASHYNMEIPDLPSSYGNRALSLIASR